MNRPKYNLKAMLAEIEQDRGLERRSGTAQLSQDDIAALFNQPAQPAQPVRDGEPCERTTRS